MNGISRYEGSTPSSGASDREPLLYRVHKYHRLKLMPNSRRTYFCAFLPIPFFQVDAKPDEGKIYRRAARNLREYHGVPSMTPPKLIQTLAFLKLHPRRLVKLGHVDGKELRAVLESMKRRRHHHHGGGHPKMAHPGLGHPRARGGGPGGPIYCVGGPRGQGGKPCGPGRRVGRGSPVEGVFLCHPPRWWSRRVLWSPPPRPPRPPRPLRRHGGLRRIA